MYFIDKKVVKSIEIMVRALIVLLKDWIVNTYLDNFVKDNSLNSFGLI
jgi:hypothetical protein